jgi:hypothetical protein
MGSSLPFCQRSFCLSREGIGKVNALETMPKIGLEIRGDRHYFHIGANIRILYSMQAFLCRTITTRINKATFDTMTICFVEKTHQSYSRRKIDVVFSRP